MHKNRLLKKSKHAERQGTKSQNGQLRHWNVKYGSIRKTDTADNCFMDLTALYAGFDQEHDCSGLRKSAFKSMRCTMPMS